MTKKLGMIGLAVVCVLLLLAGWPSREPTGAQEKPAVQKWEYKIILPDRADDPLANQGQFDRLGAEGWELCAAHSSTRPNYCVFKRPRR